MLKYTCKPKPEKSVKVYGEALRISRKGSVTLCRAITGLQLVAGKAFLDDLSTNAAKALRELLDSAESNAEFKGFDLTKLFIHASAHSGFTFRRPRRFKMHRQKRKITNIQIVLKKG